ASSCREAARLRSYSSSRSTSSPPPPPRRAAARARGRRRAVGAPPPRRWTTSCWRDTISSRCDVTRSADAAQTLCADIEKRGGRALPLQADLSEADATTRLIPQLAEVFGPVSLLINNASCFERDTIADFSVESWDTHLDTNLRAPALLMRDFARQVGAAETGANIINIIDSI
ncbi:MAG: SDR family NAD(P)-dependent oxidoreductase, partial [Pseudomonadota bacterium]|nr:SDR family NAD(P)-dependent oxidoreductase [Pseudomonadota bacterium]